MPLLIITHAHPHGYTGVEPLDLPSGAEHAEVGFITPLSVFLSGVTRATSECWVHNGNCYLMTARVRVYQ